MTSVRTSEMSIVKSRMCKLIRYTYPTVVRLKGGTIITELTAKQQYYLLLQINNIGR